MQATSECQLLLEKFQKDVRSLKTTLSNVKARIDSDTAQLIAAQNEYDVLQAQILIDRIFGIAFTATAIASAITGEGKIIDGLATDAAESLAKLVENSIKAGEIMLFIHKLEKIITTVENTSFQLETIIPLVTGVVGSMTKIGNDWTDVIGTSMDIAVNNFSDWENANLLIPEFLDTLASRWDDCKKAAELYIDSVSGLKIPSSANQVALALSGVTKKDLRLASFGTPSDTDSPALKKFYELANDPKLRALMAPVTVEDRLAKSKLLLTKSTEDQLLNALKAPSITMPTNRTALNNAATSYRQAADLMQSVNSSDANSLRDLASRVTTDVIPPITDCVDFYKTFANRQVAALSITPTKSSLEDLAVQNAKDAATGLSKAQAAQTKVLNFKNQAVLVDNALIQRNNELQLAMRNAQAQYAEHMARLEYYLSLSWLPGVGPLITALYLLLSDDLNQINNLSSQMSSLQSAINTVNAAKGIEQIALNAIVDLTASWVSLTQEANDLASLLKLISDVPATAGALANQAKATWDSLIANLNKW
ncbi:hypothetical protein GYMLUDRAFT_48602 [Collybiopsis luxurians FD-317 M1]|uniref:Uncharacterized protein n=1 Tax=Collybiopsis luxurians FD-317 M1 TaxID=944289 RepID=A0A0D0AVV4_9AGAR|nr:hypothetical protein GYMLUDRAFT_48602 [Collybiopsis luxurians FD-317 M1]